MVVDAIVLTGGESSRLGSVPKAELRVDGLTLLRRTLTAVALARAIVVVGSEPSEPLPFGVVRAREDPPFGGPVAGIDAGLTALQEFSEIASDAVLVLACDMPHIDQAVPLLVQGLLEHPGSDGVIAVDSDRIQPLAAGFRTSRLRATLDELSIVGPLAGMPMRRLIRDLNLSLVDVPAGATADVDTWDDARRLGAQAPSLSPTTRSKEPQ